MSGSAPIQLERPIGHHAAQHPAVNSAIGEYDQALHDQEYPADDQNLQEQRSSGSTSRTVGDGEDASSSGESPEELRRRRSRELGEPSGRRFGQAAMTGAVAEKQGSAGGETLLGGAEARPRGYQETEWDDKYRFWAPELRKKRRAAFKVGQRLDDALFWR